VYRSICTSPVVDRGLAHLDNSRAARHHQVNDNGKFFGSLIRHHSTLLRTPRDVRPLVASVIFPSFGACLVTSVGRTA